MKVMMIEHFLPNSIYSLELCNKLSQNNEVILVCSDKYKADSNEGYRICPIIHSKSKNALDAFFRFIGDLIKIKSLVDVEQPNIVHYQGVEHSFFESLLLKVMQKKNIKLVFTAHNILSHESKRKEREKLNHWYHYFDGIIVHNETSKKMLEESSDYSGKIYVVPHGSYDTYINDVTGKTKNTDRIVFLQFGIIRHYKGVDILVDAVNKLPKDILKKIKIIIAGSLTKRYYDFDLAAKVKEYGLESVFELHTDRIPDEDVPEYFNNADCCVFPYRHIYGSGALLMAYTFDKPVLVSDVPVFVEETDNGHTGIIFEKENSDALSAAIMDFVNKPDEEIDKMKEAIRSLVDNKYNWTCSAELTGNVYKKLAGENNAV